MERRFGISFVLVALVIGWSARQATAQDFRYALIELPLLNDDEPHSWTRAINEAGVICGASSMNSIGFHGTLWTLPNMLDLGTLAGERSEVRGLNMQGEMAGWSNFMPGNTSARHAVLWRDDEIVDLGTLGGEKSEANAINDLSQVVGGSDTVDGGGSFLWENGEMTALPWLGEGGGTAFDINNAGQIVGWSVDNSGEQRAALWENGEVTALPTLLIDPSAALAINELGQIVGQSVSTNDKTHAVAWINQQIIDLHSGNLGRHSSAWGINDVGQVVGWVGRQPANVKGFLWEAQGGMRTLNSLVPPLLRENWTFDMAYDINNAGQIPANGFIVGRQLTTYPFLITPVFPTMNLSAPAPGVAGEVNILTINDVTPGERVFFYYSLHGGGARIPDCDLQQNALQLDRPKLIGSSVADGNGVASVTKNVPIIAQGQWILMQAVVPNECAISQLVVYRFE